MNYPFCKCMNPQKIRNPHTGDYLTVGCGKCEICKRSKSSTNVLKCRLESEKHKYCMFVTLTYDEDSIPRISLIKDDEFNGIYHAVFATPRLMDGEILFDIDLSDEAISVLSSKFDNDSWPILYKRDCQLFIKRFRKHLNTFTDEKIRYYIIGEYGPKHYRPHYHALIWFDGEETFTHFGDCLTRSWKFGRIDWSLAEGPAVSYVAQYVNSSVKLPRIFTFDETEPFALHSFYLGESVLASKNKELTEEDFADFSRRGVHLNGNYSEFSVWRSFESRFFPKCYNFSQLNEFERIKAYRTYEVARIWTGQTSPIRQARVIYDDIKFFLTDKHNEFLDYWYKTYKIDSTVFDNPDDSKRLFRQIYLSLLLSKTFLYKVCRNISLNEVKNKIYLIDRYYRWKDYQCLNKQLQIQREISDDNGVDNFNLALLFDEILPDALVLQDEFSSFVMTNNKSVYSESLLCRQFRAEQLKISANSIKHKTLNDLNNIFTNF